MVYRPVKQMIFQNSRVASQFDGHLSVPQHPVPFLVMTQNMIMQSLICRTSGFSVRARFTPFVIAGTVQPSTLRIRFTVRVFRCSSTNWKRITSSSRPRNTSWPCAGCLVPRPARCSRTPRPCSCPVALDSQLVPGPDAARRSRPRPVPQRCRWTAESQLLA